MNLLPTERLQVQGPDGLGIEYFVIRPRPEKGRRPLTRLRSKHDYRAGITLQAVQAR